MNDEARVHELLAPMRQHNPKVEATELRVDRERVLGRMMQASAKPSPIILPLRWQGGKWALAATVALALGFVFARYRAEQRPEPVAAVAPTLSVSQVHGTVDQLVDGRTVRLGHSAKVPARGALKTGAAAGATVRTSFGATVRLASDTQVSGLEAVNEAGKVELSAGTVHCEVPKLRAGQQFQVLTPEARVVVMGTVFEVTVRTLEGRSETMVTVKEGVVAVHHGTETTLVHALRSWSSASASTEARVPDREPATAPEPAPVTNPKVSRSTPSAEKAPEASPSGSLAQETRLLQAALRAERAGDRERAQELFHELLQQFPASPLAPDARQGLSRTRR